MTHNNSEITILKLVGNEKASLPTKERSRVRALVHRFTKQVEAGENLEALSAELPKVRGQAHKVKRFHPYKGAQLVASIDAAAQLLKALPVDAVDHGIGDQRWPSHTRRRRGEPDDDLCRPPTCGELLTIALTALP